MLGWGRLGAAAALVVAAVISPAAATTLAHASTTGSPNGDLTISGNVMRTGWDPNEPDLGPATVSAASFGQLFSHPVQGQVLAQPLVVNRTASSPGVLIVATEDDLVYGLSPTDGQKIWEQSLGTPWSATVLGCGDLTPNIGITATPVYDPSSNTVYVLAKEAPDGPASSDPQWYMHALDADNGQERPGWPVLIGGHPDNDPTRTFNSENAGGRPGLLLLGGVVYAGFGSHCDHGPYNGYVAGVSTTTATQTALFSVEPGTTTGEGGIWQSGGGLVSDGSGQIIVTTGNGDIAPASAGNVPPSALGEAVARLAVQPNGTLKATDYFSPINGATLNQTDGDLGSGGPMAIPNGFGTASHPHLLAQVGKDGKVYLLDRDHLGGGAQGPDGTDDVLGVTQLAHGVWGHLAFWGGDGSNGGYVYLVENSGNLRALKLGATGDGTPVLSLAANSTAPFGYTSGSPVVTSDGNTANSALVWVVGVTNATGQSPTLDAYNANPHGSTLDLVYSAPLNPPGVTDNNQAHGAKFSTVATDNERVFVGTRDGYVFGFGHPSSAPIFAPPTDAGSVPVSHTSGPVAVTLTASRPVTVTGVSASAPYTVTDPPPSPVTMSTNDTRTVHLTLTPTTPGDQAGTLTVATNQGPVSFGLNGYGTQPGLLANPSSVDFGTVALPGHNSQGINVTNTSGVAETVSSVSGVAASAAPFSSSALPSIGQVIPAGASLAIPLTYAPTNASGSDTTTLNIGVDSDAEVLHVDLSGSAVHGAAKLALQPQTLNFGLVPKYLPETKTFEIQNQGNVLLTINKAKAPFGAFKTSTPVSEGQQITPDQAVIQSVTFQPTAKGTTYAVYQVSGSDGSGVHIEQLVGTDDQLTDRYVRHRSLQTLLGGPTAATHAVGNGFVRRFRQGRMYWSTSAGIHEVHGPVLRRFKAWGGSRGPAGFPQSDVKPISGGGQRAWFQHHWAIYWSGGSGAHAVHGRIAKRWLKLGAQRSSLGYPTSEQTPIAGGERQHFEHGVLSWTHHGGYQITRS